MHIYKLLLILSISTLLSAEVRGQQYALFDTATIPLPRDDSLTHSYLLPPDIFDGP